MSVRPGLWNMLSKPPEVRGGALSVFPGRVERVDGVRCGESPALAGSLLYPHYLTEGKRKRTRTRREGWQTVEALPRCCLSIGGEVWRGVVMTSRRSGRCDRPSISFCDTVRGLAAAMMWTVKTSDGAEGEARNGRRGRRHHSHWFSLSLPSLLLALLLCLALIT